MKNGELLPVAETVLDVWVTADRNMKPTELNRFNIAKFACCTY